MFESVIVDQNTHWDGPLYGEGVPREALAKVKEYLDVPHIIALIGVRRSGKSTLVRQVINHLIRDKGVPPRNILFSESGKPSVQSLWERRLLSGTRIRRLPQAC